MKRPLAWIALLFAALSSSAGADPTDIASLPLSTGATDVPPNIMFILDDSGSMTWESQYEPPGHPIQTIHGYCRDGWHGTVEYPANQIQFVTGGAMASCAVFDFSGLGQPGFISITDRFQHAPTMTSPDFNTFYYNPAFRYDAPFYPGDPNHYPSMTRINSANWSQVPVDAYLSQVKVNLVWGNSETVACNKPNPSSDELFDFGKGVCRNVIDSNGVYRYPNPVFAPGVTPPAPTPGGVYYPWVITRTGSDANHAVPPFFHRIDQVLWCAHVYGSAGGNNSFTAAPPLGQPASKWLAGKGTADPQNPDYANNPCTDRRGTLTLPGLPPDTQFFYPRFGTLPHIPANDTKALNAQSGGDFTGVTGFTRYDIVEANGGSGKLPASYYPGNSSKSAARSDCAEDKCTYDEEMTNYANWYAYYRTRLAGMKTAAGLAFRDLDSTKRVGFMAIDTLDYLKIDNFAPAHKTAWYDRFYAHTAEGNTPLHKALSQAGRHYAGKTDGINAGLPDDPVQYSCQQNFTLLTTDGLWNVGGSYDIAGKFMGASQLPFGDKCPNPNAINDQDHDPVKTPPPYYDGPILAGPFGPSPACNSLADVAMYYYNTDLRPPGSKNAAGDDVSADNVRATAKDKATYQHMTTFTLGLAVEGILRYDPDYENQTSGDFFDIKQGTRNWPNPVSFVATDGSQVDDLWHAAVNGRGKYFKARFPGEVIKGLGDAMFQINSYLGAGSAAATSSLRPTPGDNLAFIAQYSTKTWDGELEARTIDTNVGDASFGRISKTPLWSARALLDAKPWGDRRIYTFDRSDKSLRNFCVTADNTCLHGLLENDLKNWFDPEQLEQSLNWSPDQSNEASSRKLVDYLRGDKSHYDTGQHLPTDLFRSREHILGDIVHAAPVYIKKPPFDYADDHYADFRSAQATRPGVILAGANDGMLHAFATDPDFNPYYQTGGFDSATPTFNQGTNDGGREIWAYVPRMVLPKMAKLAAIPYPHQYLVDGPPVAVDVCEEICDSAAKWHSIVVAGLGAGARGYYAVDVTDPTQPKVLWEFDHLDYKADPVACLSDSDAYAGTKSSDCHVGYAFSTPVITKRFDAQDGNTGRWVALLASGYNNTAPGDGHGYLYMLDALTGKILARIATGEGSAADPSGLGPVTAFLNRRLDATLLGNNAAALAYAGDLQGNLWRFDLSHRINGKYRVDKLAQLLDPSGQSQPITARAEIGVIPASVPADQGRRVVFVGTGKYLGTSDLTSNQVQSIYGIRDGSDKNNCEAGQADQCAFAGAVEMKDLITNTMSAPVSTANGPMRGIAGATLNFLESAHKGFRIDLPAGEQVNIDLQLQAGSLLAASNAMSPGACSAGGSGWLNIIDYSTGKSVNLQDGLGSIGYPSAPIVGLTMMQIQGRIIADLTKADATTDSPLATPQGGAAIKGVRTSWREIVVE